ncbi:MAG: ComEC/Rec2 family competence protein [Candidatus Kaiserbacteria bacterium]|nr:MAG: ComEC/Rec2 family competence protein [Candidatus Kaiserbacteria bacterium]
MSARVLYGLSGGFLFGVFVGSFDADLALAAFLLVLAAAAFAVARFGALRHEAAVLACVVLVAMAGGVVRVGAAAEPPDPQLSEAVGSRVTVEGVVFAEPDMRESSIRLYVQTDTLVYQSATTSIETGILVIAPLGSDVSYGDRVRAGGKLTLPEVFDAGAGREFDYPMYLKKDGITHELSFAEVEKIGAGGRNPLKAAAIFLKRVYLDGLHAALPEPQAGLAAGITVGDKRGVGPELSDTFRAVGLTHIIVLSGYNIMIVIDYLSRALARFALPRFVHLSLSIFTAFLFSAFTGFASASVRAGSMAGIAVAARMAGRLYIASRALAVVAALMVLWNPLVLRYDPGFQLSALATFGLVFFTPIMIRKLSFLTYRFGVREIAATTLATQITVLPLLLFENGQLPVYSLFANLFALIAVPLAMLFSAMTALAGLLFGGFAAFVGLPAYALLSYIVGIAQFFASLPFASITLPAFSPVWLVLIYGGVILFVLKYGRTQTEEGEKAHG